MEDEINLKTRTNILEYSLNIEGSINDLLSGYLEIDDKEKSKNFGNKAGIPFKSKIDLLFDIDVLSLEEHKNIELLMNFRNKFLHDIDSNSFTKILKTIDSGIKNRFLKFLEPNVELKSATEKDYELACRNLFMHNFKTIIDKFKEKSEIESNKALYLKTLFESYNSLSKISIELVKEISDILIESDLENPVIQKTVSKILSSCKKFKENYVLETENYKKIEEISKLLPKNKGLL